MIAEDLAFWRASAISSTLVMLVVRDVLTVDSLATIRPVGANVPAYTIINKGIRFESDVEANRNRPVIGAEQFLFGRNYSAQEAEENMRLGKVAIQSRICALTSVHLLVMFWWVFWVGVVVAVWAFWSALYTYDSRKLA